MIKNGHSLTVIIPAFNEGEHLSVLVEQIKNKNPEIELLVIDDGSTDSPLADRYSHFVDNYIVHPYNMGNGAAIKSGIRAASGKFLLFMDGDGQHDPADIDKLLEHVKRFDMIVGARTVKQQASLARGWMNRLFNQLATYVTGFQVEDLTSGFRLMRSQTAMDLLPMLPNGYSWPTTSTLVLLRSGLSIKYVPVNVAPRKQGRSRIRPLHDGIRFFLIILKVCTLYSPFRIFLPVSAGMFLLGLLNYLYTYLNTGRFTNMSALMFTTSVIIFMMGLVSEQISQISFLRHRVRQSPTNQKASKKEEHQNSEDRVRQ